MEVHKSSSINVHQTEILSIRWNSDDSIIAAACSDGYTRLYNVSDNSLLHALSLRVCSTTPITAVSWRPVLRGTENTNRLMSASADGWVAHWSMDTLLNYSQLEGHQCMACEFSPDARTYAVSRKDFSIGIFDSETFEMVKLLEHGEGDKIGHSNNVFALKWVDSSMLISSGWDNTLIVWDVNNAQINRALLGPHVSGHAIDLRDTDIMVGAYDSREHVQFFNLFDGNKLRGIAWGNLPSMIYSAKFSKSANKGLFATVGSEIRVYLYEELREIFMEKESYEGFCCDWAHSQDVLVVGCSDGYIRFYHIKPQ